MGNGSLSPRSSLRSKWTCFFVRPWGKHSVTDPGGKWGHPVVCVRALSDCNLLTPSSWIPTAGTAEEEQYNNSPMQCGYSGLGDSEICLWGHVEAQEGGFLACWHSGDGLCCCSLLLQHLLWGHELLDKESPLGHWATSFLLPSTEGDLAQDEEWACKCLLPLDRDWAATVTLWRPALTRHLLSSSCSSAINGSWSLWGKILGATLYYPLYTCSATSRISWSVDRKGVLTEGCSRAISLAISVCCGWGCLHKSCCHSFLQIAVAL